MQILIKKILNDEKKSVFLVHFSSINSDFNSFNSNRMYVLTIIFCLFTKTFYQK